MSLIISQVTVDCVTTQTKYSITEYYNLKDNPYIMCGSQAYLDPYSKWHEILMDTSTCDKQ